MKKTILLVAGLLTLPVVTSAGFTDIYGTWVERLMGNPTSMYEQMQSFGSYGQRASIDAELSSPDGAGELHMTTDFQIDKASNLQGTIALDASGSMGDITDSVSVKADVVLNEGMLYVKPTITQLPELVPNEEKVGFQLLDGKWIQVNDTTMPTSTLPINTTNPIQLGKQLTSLISTTPILKPTKALTRNGYEIYLVEIDPTGLEQLVAGVITTIAAQVGMPTESPMILPEPSDFNDLGVKTIGVIGRKGDEIKMGMIMNKDNDPDQVVFMSTSTATQGEMMFRVHEKRTKNSLFTFSLDTDLSVPGTQNMQIKFSAPEEKVDISAQITSTAYDGGTEEITVPTGAILLSELMQGK